MFRIFFLLITVLCSVVSAAPPEVRHQAICLQSILHQADRAYYNRGEPIMGNAAYDALRIQYERLLARYPELATEQHVGVPPESADVEHSSAVLSLKKVDSEKELQDFVVSCGTNQMYCVEPKIDGLTLVLLYRDGLLARAATRGDGRTGHDVTAEIIASGAVPASLEGAPHVLEVRGELFMSQAAFEQLNRRRAADGDALLKSPRNTAAGTLRLKDYSEIAQRKLEFLVFELRDSDVSPPTHGEALSLVRETGLRTVESRSVPASEVPVAVAALNGRRAGLPYATDGIVIRLDDRAAFTALGATAHHPRGAIARKYREVPVETRLLAVEWTRSKKGRLTPVAIFEPVELQGATVERASLYSQAHLRALDLRIGDRIQVIRAGGAVPEIVGVDAAKRTGTEQVVSDPPEL
jgi:DNA ligase (NAD+)